MKPLARHFLKPANPAHRQYEALRALFVEKLSIREVAERFGYKPSTLRNMRSEFRKNSDRSFFRVNKTGPKSDPEQPLALKRRRRIVFLRRKFRLFAPG